MSALCRLRSVHTCESAAVASYAVCGCCAFPVLTLNSVYVPLRLAPLSLSSRSYKLHAMAWYYAIRLHDRASQNF